MKNNEGKLVGILGTVIIHLIAGIIFMSFQISSLTKPVIQDLVFDFSLPNEPIPEKKQTETEATQIEKILKGDQEMLNIARNLSNKSEEKINAADYIDKVKEELIKSGKLGADNFIDEKKTAAGNKGEEQVSIENEKVKDGTKEQSEESQKMAANYKGPTRIYYELPGRNHLYLPIPIYMCQGSGKVTLTIEVSQQGDVTKAQILTAESTATDPCLIETAERTASLTKFNPDYKSPKNQTGTLTYIFVAQ